MDRIQVYIGMGKMTFLCSCDLSWWPCLSLWLAFHFQTMIHNPTYRSARWPPQGLLTLSMGLVVRMLGFYHTAIPPPPPSSHHKCCHPSLLLSSSSYLLIQSIIPVASCWLIFAHTLRSAFPMKCWIKFYLTRPLAQYQLTLVSRAVLLVI